MVHHLSIAVGDLDRSAAFYNAVLTPLGYVRLWIHEVGAGYREAAVGYGLPGAEDEFAIRLRSGGIPQSSDGFHVAFRAPSRGAVVAFYQAALGNGGQDNGGSGLHPEYGPNYFAAFVLDPDGYRIEAAMTGVAPD
ncbi:MAG: VOC family protein [Verrucomicrobiales bacterium]|nr:VOC family protein [Verrucomicrobiales bacterium]